MVEHGLAIAAIKPNEVDHQCGDNANQSGEPDPHVQPLPPRKQNQPSARFRRLTVINMAATKPPNADAGTSVANNDSTARRPMNQYSPDRRFNFKEPFQRGDTSISIICPGVDSIIKGTYGVCTQCGADIDPKRLKALPNATKCISCAA